jgi:ubiquinone/menaquinone biosynthesis C-methylase UbiE
MVIVLFIFIALVPMAALLFIVATDGRYFGKVVSSWVYARLGPSIFSIRSEAHRWQTLYSDLQLRGSERILDVGTAIGDLPNSFAAVSGFQGIVIGVDLSESMLGKAEARSHLEGLGQRAGFARADLTRGLPFQAGAFDIVICLGLLETIRRPETAIGELRRVLSPDGLLVVSLYRGAAGLLATLSVDTYLAQLTAERVSGHRLVPLRRNQDALIIRLDESHRDNAR